MVPENQFEVEKNDNAANFTVAEPIFVSNKLMNRKVK